MAHSTNGRPRPTSAPIATFDPWDVVKVPFPYTDRPVRQRRPALVIAAGEIQTTHGLLWLLMITSTENRGWPGDIAVSDLPATGLPVPSIIRPAKIATVEARDAELLGVLPPADRPAVISFIRRLLGPTLGSGATIS